MSDTERMSTERRLFNELLNALRDLKRYAENQICAHEETHRGGVIWEICDTCGMKWADDEGGKPEFKWPDAIIHAHDVIAEAEQSPLTTGTAHPSKDPCAAHPEDIVDEACPGCMSDGPDFSDGTDAEGFRGPRPMTGMTAPAKQRYEESNLYRLGERYARLGELLKNPDSTITDIVDFCEDNHMELGIKLVPKFPSMEAKHEHGD